jgi:hypothetical protein
MNITKGASRKKYPARIMCFPICGISYLQVARGAILALFALRPHSACFIITQKTAMINKIGQNPQRLNNAHIRQSNENCSLKIGIAPITLIAGIKSISIN